MRGHRALSFAIYSAWRLRTTNPVPPRGPPTGAWFRPQQVHMGFPCRGLASRLAPPPRSHPGLWRSPRRTVGSFAFAAAASVVSAIRSQPAWPPPPEKEQRIARSRERHRRDRTRGRYAKRSRQNLHFHALRKYSPCLGAHALTVSRPAHFTRCDDACWRRGFDDACWCVTTGTGSSVSVSGSVSDTFRSQLVASVARRVRRLAFGFGAKYHPHLWTLNLARMSAGVHRSSLRY